ncbi:MAG: GGDEF domain-containing protein [Desulfobacterales bacterium CG23_combo_of_CG06-09_8_20_14_all_52_9]|nr:MAG: GGDEF domain-containing protein [Desulfobacterales bacterium CG23_combo_of_CG06-09_8_20_14_all_52_9]
MDFGMSSDTENKLQACLEIGKTLIATFKIQEILELIMTKISQLIPAHNWSLLLEDEATGELRFEIAVGIDKSEVKDIRIRPGEGIAGTVFSSGKPIFIPDVRKDGRFNHKVDQETGFVTRSIYCVPVQAKDRVLGVIEIINVNDVDSFEDRYLSILTILSDYVAIAVENSQLFAQVERLSITDEYTGHYNARFLHQNLKRFIAEANRSREGLTVAFVDIDDFKTIVDTHGHLAAGQVLKEVAGTIASRLSQKDVLIKYGGDEYVLIFRDKGRTEAVRQMDSIAQSIKESRYLISETPDLTLTASFGMAVYPEDAETEKDLLILADNAMFAAKRARKKARFRRE